MRVVISSVQQNLKNKRIKDILHVKSSDQIADVFTKSGVCTNAILDVIQKGSLIRNQTQDKISRSGPYCQLKDYYVKHNDQISCDMEDIQEQDQASTDVPKDKH